MSQLICCHFFMILGCCMNLHLSALVSKKINNSILISGSARSGTTIIGKIIHSFEGVEYAFEPPLLFTLFSMIETFPQDEWMLLFESYLYEDFFINAVAGRSINCNRRDDSSIYNVKDHQEIEKRLSKSLSKNEAEEKGKHKVISFKMPDIVPYLLRFQQYYPDIKIVIMKRECISTINSLVAKKWFAEENSQQNFIWPFRMHNGSQIPYWVRAEDDDAWSKMSELDKCAYYYIRVNEDIPKIRNGLVVNYHKLLSDPLGTSEKLATELNLKFGKKTKEIVDQVKPTNRKRDVNIIDRISPELREKVKYYSSIS